MRTVSTVQELRAAIRQERERGKRIAFVPTMGNLHEGHITLVREALQQADHVVTSIFVNPLQFGPTEDLERYPRTLAADQAKLEEVGNHLVFTPNVEELYPEGLAAHTRVTVPNLTNHHCGSSRPGHFDGVTTVVNILLNAVQPDIAIFGQKDFQQLAVIRKMVADLLMPIEIIGVPTAREKDGLARSSRNGYLTAKERKVAPKLYAALKDISAKVTAGDRDFRTLETQLSKKLGAAGFRVDYANIAHADTLAPANPEDNEIVLLVAAFLGTTRLIDNIRLSLSDTPA